MRHTAYVKCQRKPQNEAIIPNKIQINFVWIVIMRLLCAPHIFAIYAIFRGSARQWFMDDKRFCIQHQLNRFAQPRQHRSFHVVFAIVICCEQAPRVNDIHIFLMWHGRGRITYFLIRRVQRICHCGWHFVCNSERINRECVWIERHS